MTEENKPPPARSAQARRVLLWALFWSTVFAVFGAVFGSRDFNVCSGAFCGFLLGALFGLFGPRD